MTPEHLTVEDIERLRQQYLVAGRQMGKNRQLLNLIASTHHLSPYYNPPKRFDCTNLNRRKGKGRRNP